VNTLKKVLDKIDRGEYRTKKSALKALNAFRPFMSTEDTAAVDDALRRHYAKPVTQVCTSAEATSEEVFVIPCHIFSFGAYKIRTVKRGAEEWFVANDICAALDLRNPRDVVSELDSEDRGVEQVDTPGGAQGVNVVNQYGVYEFVLRSRKKEARAFQRWLTHEVLPSLAAGKAVKLGVPRKEPEQLELPLSKPAQVPSDADELDVTTSSEGSRHVLIRARSTAARALYLEIVRQETRQVAPVAPAQTLQLPGGSMHLENVVGEPPPYGHYSIHSLLVRWFFRPTVDAAMNAGSTASVSQNVRNVYQEVRKQLPHTARVAGAVVLVQNGVSQHAQALNYYHHVNDMGIVLCGVMRSIKNGYLKGMSLLLSSDGLSDWQRYAAAVADGKQVFPAEYKDFYDYLQIHNQVG
jgi:hypothetical protein